MTTAVCCLLPNYLLHNHMQKMNFALLAARKQDAVQGLSAVLHVFYNLRIYNKMKISNS